MSSHVSKGNSAVQNSFAVELNGIDRDKILRSIGAATVRDAERVIDRAGVPPALSPDDLLPLVSPAAAVLIEPMARQARSITARRFGKTISLYAPLYISNYCSNSCVYCGFSAANQVARRALSLQDILHEAAHLRNRHLSQLLLVTGESPGHCGAGELARAAAALKPSFPSLAVETFPMGTDEYQALQASGVDGLVIYQETYDRTIYRQVHPAGPKSDFDYRLAAAERGGQAGFRQIGIGSLLGLSDWRVEAYCLARHAAFLAKHYWQSHISVSFPRLRPAAGGYQPLHPVSGPDLAQMIFALRLILPDAGLVLSTREPAVFRDNMMGLGITKMSAGSKTAPGGYLDGNGAGGQFDVCDDRSVEEVAAAIRRQGYDPVWKDWDAGFEPATLSGHCRNGVA